MEENQDKTNNDEVKDTPWSSIGIGLFLFAAAGFLYYVFNNLENEGGSVKINWIFALLYRVGGKWAAPGLIGIIGAFYTYSGIKAFSKK